MIETKSNLTKGGALRFDPKDFKNASPVKWCPGCGDHGVLVAVHKAMAQLGVAPDETVVVSGIGCSSRLPYYMSTFGFHTVHGRGAAVATGVKVARPDLTVWLMSGDGDSLAIGGNHFIHAVRRNVDINEVLFNNRIYGLTKGQYSPTSPRGLVTKSSPYGTVEDPFEPAELVMGARGNFFARSLDVDQTTLTACLLAGAQHKGFAVTEVLVNCMIFNNGTHATISDRAVRADKTIVLRHGEKMTFGENNERGLVLDGFQLRAVTIGEEGYTLDDVLTHDAHEPNPFLHMMLAAMTPAMGLPVAMGVIRDVEAPTYDWAVHDQIAEQQTKNKVRTLHELLMTEDTWEIK